MKVIKAGLVIDGTGKEPIVNGSVLIEGSAIKAVLSGPENKSLPNEAEVIDVSGSVIMPGFIDAHVHLRNPHLNVLKEADRYKSRIETEPALAVFYGAHSAQMTLTAGFTTIRNMGGIEYVSLRKAIDAGLIPGPKILTSGMVLMTAGHTDRTLPRTLPRTGPWQAWETADGVDVVRCRVREHVFAGADFIKTETSGGLHCPDFRSYTRAEIEAIVDEAHGMNVKVAAHAHGQPGILRAVEAGVDSIEHGTFLDEACIEKMVQWGTAFIPTFAIMNASIVHGPELGYSEELITKYKALQNIRMEAVRKAHAAGIPIVLGTDTSWRAPHGENGVEFRLLVEAGLTPMESIMAGTSAAAKALGLEGLVGTIEPGKRADLVVLRSSPLHDISILENRDNVLQVWKDGAMIVERIPGEDVPQLRWQWLMG